MREDGNEAVQFPVDFYFAGNLCTKQFEPTVVVMKDKTRQAADRNCRDSPDARRAVLPP